MCCSVLQCVAVCCSQNRADGILPPWIELACCNVLQCVAVCCSVLHPEQSRWNCATLNRASVLQCVAVCCSVLQSEPSRWNCATLNRASVLQYVAMFCSVLQYVAVCCSRNRANDILARRIELSFQKFWKVSSLPNLLCKIGNSWQFVQISFSHISFFCVDPQGRWNYVSSNRVR